MSHTLQFGTNEKPIVVEFADDHQEFFADGVAGLAVGYPVSKITLTSKSPYQENEEKEHRKAVCTFALPTIALLEIAKLAYEAIKNNEDFIKDASENQSNHLSRTLQEFAEMAEK